MSSNFKINVQYIRLKLYSFDLYKEAAASALEQQRCCAGREVLISPAFFPHSAVKSFARILLRSVEATLSAYSTFGLSRSCNETGARDVRVQRTLQSFHYCFWRECNSRKLCKYRRKGLKWNFSLIVFCAHNPLHQILCSFL